MAPKAGQGGSWSTEEKLDLIVRIMYHNNKYPKYKDMKLPPGRTAYAVDHLLRKIKSDWTKKMEESESSEIGSNQEDENEYSTKRKPKRTRAKSSTTRKHAKDDRILDSVVDDDEEIEGSDVKKVRMEQAAQELVA